MKMKMKMQMQMKITLFFFVGKEFVLPNSLEGRTHNAERRTLLPSVLRRTNSLAPSGGLLRRTEGREQDRIRMQHRFCVIFRSYGKEFEDGAFFFAKTGGRRKIFVNVEC